MKRIKKLLLLFLVIGLSIACLAFFFINVNRGVTIPVADPKAQIKAVNEREEEAEIATKLKEAPWQGLRFLPDQQEWRFYALVGEQRKITLSLPFDVVKVYFLQADGDLSYTWAATGVEIPGKGYYTSATSPVQPGDLAEVAIGGDYVTQYGVEWDQCSSEYCHLAQMIDSTLILDDKGTGLTNGFIREGWEPPTTPMYGFLCWQIRPYTDKRVAQNAASLH